MAIQSAKSETNCPFPVWSIFITTSPSNPSAIWMQTYWIPFAKGKTIFWVDNKSKIDKLKKVEQEWGAYTHQHDLESWSGWDWSGDARAGKTKAASSLPPFITVFMWKRVTKETAENTKDFYNPYGIENPWDVLWVNAIVDPETISAEFPNGKPIQDKPYYVW